MSKLIDRLKELGKAYVPRVEKGQSVDAFVKGELEKNGVSRAAFVASEYFKSGDFARNGELEAKLSEELGGPSAKEPKGAKHATSIEENDGDTTKAPLHSATGDESDKKDPLKVSEYSEHDEGEVLKNLRKAEEDGDDREVARLTKALEDLRHTEGKGLANLQDAGGGSLMAASKAATDGDTRLEASTDDVVDEDIVPDAKVVEPEAVQSGEKMVFLYDVRPSEKMKTEPYGNVIRVFGGDVSDLVVLPWLDATKPRHHAWNWFVSLFVKQVQNVKPVKSTELNADGAYGMDVFSSCKRRITDPEQDSYNLLSYGGGGADSTTLTTLYARMDGVDVSTVRRNGRIRVDMNFTGIPTGASYALANQAAVLSGDMYTDQGTAIMSEQRVSRLNVGMLQYRMNSATPDMLLKMYGNSANAFKLKSSADAIFTEHEVKYYATEKPGFEIWMDLTFCVTRGWGNAAIAIPSFSLTALIARDEEMGRGLRDQSMAESVESIAAFNPTLESPINVSLGKKIMPDMLTAAANITALNAARFATTCAQYHAGGAFRQLTMEMEMDQYTKQIAPYACFATAVMTYFPAFTHASQIAMIDAMLRPFCGNVTPGIRASVMGAVNAQAGFVNDCMAQIVATGFPIFVRGLANVVTRGILAQVYQLIRVVTRPQLNNAVDGRFYTYRQDRAPKMADGTVPPAGTPLSQMYGTRHVQKGVPVAGNFYDRDMHAITWNNLQAYQNDVNIYSGYSVMINEQTYSTAFAPFSSKFMNFLRLVGQVLSPNERQCITLFQNYGTDLMHSKGGGILNMSLKVMHASHQDHTMMAGVGYQGVMRYELDPGGSLQNFGEIPIDMYGALSYMAHGIESVDTATINRFNALERLTIGNVGTLYEKNVQMAIMIANDVMATACDPAVIDVLNEPLLRARFGAGVVGAYNEYYLQTYQDEVLKVVERVCQVYYKAGSVTEKFAKDWVINRANNRRPGSPFQALYWDYAPFQDNGYTRVSLLNMRSANDVQVSGPTAGGLALRMPYLNPAGGFGAGLYNAEITRAQMPFTVNQYNGGVNVQQHEYAPTVADANDIMQADFVIAGGCLDLRPTTPTGPMTVMGLQYNEKNRYMLVTRDCIVPCENYGMRTWDTAIQKVSLFNNGAHGLALSLVPFDGGDGHLTRSLPRQLRGNNFAASGSFITMVSKEDYQRFCTPGGGILFDPVAYAEWMTNYGVLCDVTQDELLSFMQGGIDMHHLPTRQALVAQGVSVNFANAIAGYPNVAYLLSDLKTLVNDAFVGKGGPSPRLRPWRNAPGFNNLYGNGLVKYALHQMSGNFAFQAQTSGDAMGRFLNRAYQMMTGGAGAAQMRVSGDENYCRVANYYAKNTALVATLMTALVRGSSFSERAMVMIKTDVAKELQEVKDTTTFAKVEMPGVKVISKDYFSGLTASQGQAGVDGGRMPNGALFSKPSIPLDALKVVTDSKVIIPYTSTDRAHAVNIVSHATTMNPNVDDRGRYISPLFRTRREQSIVAVVGCSMTDYTVARRVNVIPDQVATAHTSGRNGSDVILAPSPFPIPDATRGGDMELPVPVYTPNVPVRCIMLYDRENDNELLERRYAIPVIAPDSVTVMPFEFETVGVHTSTLAL